LGLESKPENFPSTPPLAKSFKIKLTMAKAKSIKKSPIPIFLKRSLAFSFSLGSDADLTYKIPAQKTKAAAIKIAISLIQIKIFSNIETIATKPFLLSPEAYFAQALSYFTKPFLARDFCKLQ
jgi:hypothetical protein